eukprot:8705859-Alexandrium_andersonii.AAC.1
MFVCPSRATQVLHLRRAANHQCHQREANNYGLNPSGQGRSNATLTTVAKAQCIDKKLASE